MILDTKTHSDLELGLADAILRSKAKNFPILFSYTFQFESRDVLPLLSHPADKHAC